LYTLLDWPGLRTSIVTCFFVAFGSLGETVHKLTLRIVGALIGGALAGLCIVFVLPHCTDIGQLCLVIAVVSAGAGWIATSSERLAYAGLQIAFAFFIGVLQDYAPATDLTVLRDRVVGILLGNVVMTLVFSTLWPQSAAGRVRSAIGQSLRAVAALIKSPLDAEANRQRAARTLVAAEHFRILRAFELRLVPGHLPLERLVASLKKFALFEAWIFVLSLDQNARDHRQQDCHALSDWALAAAAVAESGGAWPEPPNLSPGCSVPLQKAQRAAVETVKEAQVIEGPA
jgi:multidrug resistance protein MdtO